MSRQTTSSDIGADPTAHWSGIIRGVLPRLTLVVVSVLAIAWLGLMLRAELISQDVAPRLAGGVALSNEEFRSDLERLDSSRLLNPDPAPRFVLAAAWLSRDPRRAARELDRLVRAEPENVSTWRALYVATRGFDRRRSAAAAARIRRLDPRAGR